eukprot:c22455_g1_i2 orf=315-662(+)
MTFRITPLQLLFAMTIFILVPNGFHQHPLEGSRYSQRRQLQIVSGIDRITKYSENNYVEEVNCCPNIEDLNTNEDRWNKLYIQVEEILGQNLEIDYSDNDPMPRLILSPEPEPPG